MDEATSSAGLAQTRQKRVQPTRARRGAVPTQTDPIDSMIFDHMRRKPENDPLIAANTNFLLSTNAADAIAPSSDGASGIALNVVANERYFSRPEVIKACREQGEIQTPSYESMDTIVGGGRLRARPTEEVADTSDAAYEKRHKKFEVFEKRHRGREREKLKHEHYKLCQRIEQLRTMDSAVFLSFPADVFSPVPNDQAQEEVESASVYTAFAIGAFPSAEGERRRNEMLEVASVLEQRTREVLDMDKARKAQVPTDAGSKLAAHARDQEDTERDRTGIKLRLPARSSGSTTPVPSPASKSSPAPTKSTPLKAPITAPKPSTKKSKGSKVSTAPAPRQTPSAPIPGPSSLAHSASHAFQSVFPISPPFRLEPQSTPPLPQSHPDDQFTPPPPLHQVTTAYQTNGRKDVPVEEPAEPMVEPESIPEFVGESPLQTPQTPLLQERQSRPPSVPVEAPQTHRTPTPPPPPPPPPLPPVDAPQALPYEPPLPPPPPPPYFDQHRHTEDVDEDVDVVGDADESYHDSGPDPGRQRPSSLEMEELTSRLSQAAVQEYIAQHLEEFPLLRGLQLLQPPSPVIVVEQPQPQPQPQHQPQHQPQPQFQSQSQPQPQFQSQPQSQPQPQPQPRTQPQPQPQPLFQLQPQLQPQPQLQSQLEPQLQPQLQLESHLQPQPQPQPQLEPRRSHSPFPPEVEQIIRESDFAPVHSPHEESPMVAPVQLEPEAQESLSTNRPRKRAKTAKSRPPKKRTPSIAPSGLQAPSEHASTPGSSMQPTTSTAVGKHKGKAKGPFMDFINAAGETEVTTSVLMISALRSLQGRSQKGHRNVNAFGVRVPDQYQGKELYDFELPDEFFRDASPPESDHENLASEEAVVGQLLLLGSMGGGDFSSLPPSSSLPALGSLVSDDRPGDIDEKVPAVVEHPAIQTPDVVKETDFPIAEAGAPVQPQTHDDAMVEDEPRGSIGRAPHEDTEMHVPPPPSSPPPLDHLLIDFTPTVRTEPPAEVQATASTTVKEDEMLESSYIDVVGLGRMEEDTDETHMSGPPLGRPPMVESATHSQHPTADLGSRLSETPTPLQRPPLPTKRNRPHKKSLQFPLSPLATAANALQGEPPLPTPISVLDSANSEFMQVVPHGAEDDYRGLPRAQAIPLPGRKGKSRKPSVAGTGAGAVGGTLTPSSSYTSLRGPGQPGRRTPHRASREKEQEQSKDGEESLGSDAEPEEYATIGLVDALNAAQHEDVEEEDVSSPPAPPARPLKGKKGSKGSGGAYLGGKKTKKGKKSEDVDAGYVAGAEAEGEDMFGVANGTTSRSRSGSTVSGKAKRPRGRGGSRGASVGRRSAQVASVDPDETEEEPGQPFEVEDEDL